jgi:hypothetical protein
VGIDLVEWFMKRMSVLVFFCLTACTSSASDPVADNRDASGFSDVSDVRRPDSSNDGDTAGHDAETSPDLRLANE